MEAVFLWVIAVPIVSLLFLTVYYGIMAGKSWGGEILGVLKRIAGGIIFSLVTIVIVGGLITLEKIQNYTTDENLKIMFGIAAGSAFTIAILLWMTAFRRMTKLAQK